jgi:hypothetical protein
MPPTTDKTHFSYTTLNRNLEGLVWNADLSLQDASEAASQRRQAIDEARASRPRTAQIEREIMVAVIVLYALILGSFAALHLYGGYVLDQQNPTTQAAEPATPVGEARAEVQP